MNFFERTWFTLVLLLRAHASQTINDYKTWKKYRIFWISKLTSRCRSLLNLFHFNWVCSSIRPGLCLIKYNKTDFIFHCYKKCCFTLLTRFFLMVSNSLRYCLFKVCLTPSLTERGRIVCEEDVQWSRILIFQITICL